MGRRGNSGSPQGDCAKVHKGQYSASLGLRELGGPVTTSQKLQGYQASNRQILGSPGPGHKIWDSGLPSKNASEHPS